MSRTPIYFDAATEPALWQEYHRTRSVEARNAIAVRYRPLLGEIAGLLIERRGLPAEVEADDLISEGFFGLLQAIERFDPSRGLKFATFAQQRVRGAMLDHLRNSDWMSRQVRHRTRLKADAIERLTVIHGRPPTRNEIKAVVHPDKAEAERIVATEHRHMLTLSAVESRSYGKGEPPKQEDAPELSATHAGFDQVDSRDYFDSLLSKLPKRDQFILSMLLGGLTFKQIAQRLRRSESLVSVLRSRIIALAQDESFAA